jgi:site-specific DNA recombinase
MLAIYLATPQVENMRRGLNVFYGMRQARKEGRWMGTAPVGYANLCTEAGKKYIAPKEKEGRIMKWAFEELATGNFNTQQIWRMARQKGLRCSKNNFWVAIKNPLYCGKIFVPPYKDEEGSLITGLHESLITEDLFYRVQDVLSGPEK